ncbi:peptidase T [Desulfosediminicola ganghwensis]|uniref:peptidase T n=1 Tax=Desulfosediminicola ganghwensis TaxID=2569540 RepID=UPI0010AD269B|nr:peptidase T [Desulfosediminicola ganghwensis]
MPEVTLDIPVAELVDRFCRYVAVDTQAAVESETYPSTFKQLDLCRILVAELYEMGITDARMTKPGYVIATVPANSVKKVPTIGLIAHVDTSPDVSGKNVKPVIHENYSGGDIVLPGDATQVIRADETPELGACIGDDIITSDGTTLLGADDKAGVAEIMTAIRYLVDHPELAHGPIRIAFTVDEEVGTGTKHFDVKKFAADYAYTIDGSTAGEVEDETFSADSVTVTFQGVNIHPGYAKGKMLNSTTVAAEFISFLPREMTPETTEDREGFMHLHSMEGTVNTTVLKYLIRDFTLEGLLRKETLMQETLRALKAKYPALDYTFEVEESYRNMKYVLDQYPRVTEYCCEAIRRCGLTPRQGLIRGGTDGARLSEMGLPTPNIFTGGHNFHSKTEWISVQDMTRAVETIVHLAMIWEEKSNS